MPDEPRLEEEALSQAVEMAISSQLDEVENLYVDVRTDLLKMILGKADSVKVAGSGLKVQKDVRVQELQMYADRVNINPLSALLGQIELNQPVDTLLRIVLTEDDINQALNSDYIKTKLKPIDLCVDNKIVPVELQLPASLHLPGDDTIKFTGKVLLHETNNTSELGFSATILPRTQEHPLRLAEFYCTQGTGITLELALAFIQKLKELIESPYFEVEGMALRIKGLSVKKGSMTAIAEAHIYQMPSVEG